MENLKSQQMASIEKASGFNFKTVSVKSIETGIKLARRYGLSFLVLGSSFISSCNKETREIDSWINTQTTSKQINDNGNAPPVILTSNTVEAFSKIYNSQKEEGSYLSLKNEQGSEQKHSHDHVGKNYHEHSDAPGDFHFHSDGTSFLNHSHASPSHDDPGNGEYSHNDHTNILFETGHHHIGEEIHMHMPGEGENHAHSPFAPHNHQKEEGRSDHHHDEEAETSITNYTHFENEGQFLQFMNPVSIDIHAEFPIATDGGTLLLGIEKEPFELTPGSETHFEAAIFSKEIQKFFHFQPGLKATFHLDQQVYSLAFRTPEEQKISAEVEIPIKSIHYEKENDNEEEHLKIPIQGSVTYHGKSWNATAGIDHEGQLFVQPEISFVTKTGTQLTVSSIGKINHDKDFSLLTRVTVTF